MEPSLAAPVGFRCTRPLWDMRGQAPEWQALADTGESIQNPGVREMSARFEAHGEVGLVAKLV
jgi:hypothetical protein